MHTSFFHILTLEDLKQTISTICDGIGVCNLTMEQSVSSEIGFEALRFLRHLRYWKNDLVNCKGAIVLC